MSEVPFSNIKRLLEAKGYEEKEERERKGLIYHTFRCSKRTPLLLNVPEDSDGNIKKGIVDKILNYLDIDDLDDLDE